MATYKVLKPRFHGGMLYEPGGKRSTLTVDKPFKELPDGLELIKDQTPQQKAAATKKANAEKLKAAEDKIEVDAVMHVESPKATPPKEL